MGGIMRSACSGLDEKREGRIFQPHRQPGADAEVGPKIPGRVSIFRTGTDAHGAGSRRSVHECYSARLSSPGRSTHLPLAGRNAALHPAALARLREANRSAHDEGPLARFDSPRRFGIAFDPDGVRQSRLHFESARNRTGDDEESGESGVIVVDAVFCSRFAMRSLRSDGAAACVAHRTTATEETKK